MKEYILYVYGSVAGWPNLGKALNQLKPAPILPKRPAPAGTKPFLNSYSRPTLGS
jgi:hypothetical protein